MTISMFRKFVLVLLLNFPEIFEDVQHLVAELKSHDSNLDKASKTLRSAENLLHAVKAVYTTPNGANNS